MALNVSCGFLSCMQGSRPGWLRLCKNDLQKSVDYDTDYYIYFNKYIFKRLFTCLFAEWTINLWRSMAMNAMV